MSLTNHEVFLINIVDVFCCDLVFLNSIRQQLIESFDMDHRLSLFALLVYWLEEDTLKLIGMGVVRDVESSTLLAAFQQYALLGPGQPGGSLAIPEHYGH